MKAGVRPESVFPPGPRAVSAGYPHPACPGGDAVAVRSAQQVKNTRDPAAGTAPAAADFSGDIPRYPWKCKVELIDLGSRVGFTMHSDSKAPHASVFSASDRFIPIKSQTTQISQSKASGRTLLFENVQFSSVARSCPTEHARDCSTPGPPVHYRLPGFTPTHVH